MHKNPFVDEEAVVVNDEESESDDAEEANGKTLLPLHLCSSESY